MKVPLYKLFLVQAAYAVPLALLARWGYWGIASALVFGTGLSGLILVARKKDFLTMFAISIGAILGGLVGASCLGAPVITEHGVETTAGIIVGAFVGAALTSAAFITPRKS